MTWLLLLPFLAVTPALIAYYKGRSPVLWWLYGMLLFIVALPHAILMPSAYYARRCPYCAEGILQDAVVCRFCCRDIGEDALVAAGDDGTCPRCASKVAPGLPNCPECGASFTSGRA